MITFDGGVEIREGGPNPLANMDSRGSLSASGFGPGGPYPLADLDRGGPNQGGSKSARTLGLIFFLFCGVSSNSCELMEDIFAMLSWSSIFFVMIIILNINTNF